MDWTETIVSVGALLLIIVSICVKKRRLSVLIQGASCGLQFIYELLIGAFTAAVGEGIDVVRSVFFVYKEKFSSTLYSLLLVIFEAIIIVSCIITWDGPLSLLPTLGTMFRTYAAWQTRMGLIRVAGIVTGLLYVPYFICYDSVVMATGYMILLLVGIYEVIKHRDLEGGDGCSDDDKPIKKSLKAREN